MADRTLEIRRAILAHMKDFDAVVDLVAPESIYPQQPPAMPPLPFIRYGAPSVVPLRASCVNGCELSVAIHAFSNGVEEDGALAETAEDHASRIGAAIAQALDGYRLDLDEGGKALVRWAGSQVLQDPDTVAAYHAIVSVTVRTLN